MNLALAIEPGRYFQMHMIGYFEGVNNVPATWEPRQGSRSFLAVADAFASAARGAREGFRLRVEARG